LDALFASAPTGNKGQGLIEAYQKDPQKFRRYADMLDTAMNAKQVGDAVLRQDIRNGVQYLIRAKVNHVEQAGRLNVPKAGNDRRNQSGSRTSFLRVRASLWWSQASELQRRNTLKRG
jgi:hypothetical protein